MIGVGPRRYAAARPRSARRRDGKGPSPLFDPHPGTDADMWRILLLHYTPRPRAVRLTTQQHLRALTRLPEPAQVLSYNAVHGAPSWLRHLAFDAVVLHTTLLCQRWNPWFSQWKRHVEWIGDVDCLKIAFPQDEYDHAEVLDEWLDEAGVSVVCTVLDDLHRQDLYPRLSRKAAFYETLTGYIDDDAAARFRTRMLPRAERPTDIVYRARHLPYWYGSHGQLKHAVGDIVAERAPEYGLSCDISTRAQETILGDAWLDFLGTARATVGVESGTSVFNRRGEVRDRVLELLQGDPGLSFDALSALMPAGWDDYRFFAISPRHLEAVATKTAQILVEGRYSGVLEPDRHYIPIRRDFSNLDEALESAREPAVLDRIAEQAYKDIYLSGRFSFTKLTALLEDVLREHAGPPRRPMRAPAFLPLVERLAAAQSNVGRVVGEPLSGVVRIGPSVFRELLAGTRLALTDADLRRLLLDYLRSSEVRQYVSPRGALADLLCLGAMRRAQRRRQNGDEPFGVATELDEGLRRMLFRSHRPDAVVDGTLDVPSGDRLEALLRESAWQFLWDHSSVGTSASYPIAARISIRLSLPPGPHPLPLLDWLARQRPSHVAAALAPVLQRPAVTRRAGEHQ